jgi:uncharacterized membrane protein YqgA involved in biofilm formation
MNGESKRSFTLAVVSFAIGAVVAGVLSNPKTLEKISESSKNLVKRTKKLAERTDLA